MRKECCKLMFAGILTVHCCATIRSMKKGDPNLNANWNWQKNEINVMYYSPNGSATTECWSRLPYYTSGNGMNSARLPDIYPEDGWGLVHKDFGVAGDGQPFPFFTMYNKYRGIFRIMVFNANNRSGTFFSGELSFLDGGKYPEAAAGIMAFADRSPWNFFYSLKNYNPQLVLKAYSNMTAYGSWAVFDFPFVGFDKELRARDPIVVFRLTSIDKQEIMLKSNGDIQLYQAIENNKARPNTAFSPESAMYLAQKGFATYKTVQSFIQNEILSEAGRKKHKDEIWFNTAKSIASGALGSYIPVIGAMGAVLESFVGGASRASEWESLNFTGQFKFSTEGAILTRHDLWCHNLFLNVGPMDDARAQRPLRSVDWGIFSFLDFPKCQVTYAPYRRNDWSGSDATVKLVEEPQIGVNPDMGMDLQSIKVAFVKNDSQAYMLGDRTQAVLSEFMTVKDAMVRGFLYDQRSERMTVNELVWELRFKIRNPTKISDEEIVIYKRTALLS